MTDSQNGHHPLRDIITLLLLVGAVALGVATGIAGVWDGRTVLAVLLILAAIGIQWSKFGR